MPTPRNAADMTGPLVNVKGKEKKRSKQKDKVDEPCRLFSAGKCTRGDRCRYRHEFAEGSTVDSASLESPLPGGGSSKDMSGPVDGDSTTPAALMSQKPIPQNSGSSHKRCFAWRRKGSCSKGGNCPYKHDNEFKKTLEGNRCVDKEQRFRIGKQRREAIRRRHEMESAEYERRAVERDADFLARVRLDTRACRRVLVIIDQSRRFADRSDRHIINHPPANLTGLRV
ncbi:hypothetical protein DFH08DRAFT_467628 [Mycena albidolilacea]|uniref:C3H1-type domain-containing protein n=1 Tax=Mycena albidolilacea TaxID=1033008 RepID=A0AAD7AF60_9AGAR|nr:hypothetical protein DFH08DRAFT_467628 [Mycena albidolilacea]